MVVIIKLGGGLIAPKDWKAETADIEVIKRLSKEIAEAKKKNNFDLVVVSGSGNFGHAAVKKYGIADKLAAAKVQIIAQKIGEIVTQSLLDVEISACLVSPHDIWVTKDGKIILDEGEQLVKLLEQDLTPVLYGDVIWDMEKTAVIFSGERCISSLVPTLIKSGHKIDKIIQVSKEDGVWDSNKRIIPEITSKNWPKIKKDVTGAVGVDVTGGMLHKVEESLEIANKYLISSAIVNGKKDRLLFNTLVSKKILGTEIC